MSKSVACRYLDISFWVSRCLGVLLVQTFVLVANYLGAKVFPGDHFWLTTSTRSKKSIYQGDVNSRETRINKLCWQNSTFNVLSKKSKFFSHKNCWYYLMFSQMFFHVPVVARVTTKTDPHLDIGEFHTSFRPLEWGYSWPCLALIRNLSKNVCLLAYVTGCQPNYILILKALHSLRI